MGTNKRCFFSISFLSGAYGKVSAGCTGLVLVHQVCQNCIIASEDTVETNNGLLALFLGLRSDICPEPYGCSSHRNRLPGWVCVFYIDWLVP
jgi:hypothetical protein